MKNIDFRAILDLLRVRQYYKNLLVLSPIVFAYRIAHVPSLISVSLAFIGFCALSSLIYILNDIVDVERDRHHPKKSKRPLPSGRISVNLAIITMVFLIMILWVILIELPFEFTLVAVTYIVLNLMYIFWLKTVFLIDVFTIGFGFILRVLGGSLAIGVMLSPWLFTAAFLLALVLGFSKRASELDQCKDGELHRESLAIYEPLMLRAFVILSTTCAVIVYLLYATLVVQSNLFIFTTIFVLYGTFRFISMALQNGFDPDELYRDRPFVLNIGLWILAVMLTLYLPN